jgi:hypothetical protein
MWTDLKLSKERKKDFETHHLSRATGQKRAQKWQHEMASPAAYRTPFGMLLVLVL